MNQIVKMSQLYAPTLKEAPSEAELASHVLMLRAGMIRKMAAGLYTYLPLGWRVIRKIERIVDEEMVAIGAQEIMMPILQPSELWHESGRWEAYGPELMRLEDRHGRGFCLGPTHEELITAVTRNELRSYTQLPTTLYQTQSKFRDEIRPRFGVMRSREFVMKDAYSFNATQESLQETYDDMYGAYSRVCERLGLEYRPVDADSGQIGGKVSVEFMALADSGEAELVYCDCGYAADVEAAEAGIAVISDTHDQLERFATPGVATISELAEFVGCPENATVKALSGVGDDGVITVFFIPGDHDLNDFKANRAVPGYRFLTDEEMVEAGLPKGSMGPVRLPDGVRIICDSALGESAHWLVGANESGYHLHGATPGRDFEVDAWEDLSTATEGDLCPVCGKPLSSARGIEVSQIFQLGTKYSEAMNATFMNAEGKETPFIMGCYGIGITRSMAAIIEQHNDEHGIIWPLSVAPAEVAVIPLSVDDDVVWPVAEMLADELLKRGIETVIDDRDERAGVKFNDADLYGWPYQVVCGKRAVAAGEVEVKDRRTGEKTMVAIDDAARYLADIVETERARCTHEAVLAD